MDIYSISKRSGSKGKKSGNRGKKNTRRRVKRTKRMRTKRNSKRVSKRISKRRNVKNVKRKSRRQTKRRVSRRRSRRVMRGGRPGRELVDRLDLARDPKELDARMRREAPSEIFRGELELFAKVNARYIMDHSESSVAGLIIAEKELEDLGVENNEEIQAIVREKRDELEGNMRAAAVEVDLEQKGDEAEASRAAMEEEEMDGSTMTMKEAWGLMKGMHPDILTDIYAILRKHKDILSLDEKFESEDFPSAAAAMDAYMTMLGEKYFMGATEKKILAQIIHEIDGEYTKETRKFLMRQIKKKLGF